MQRDYWQKQATQALFPDIEWLKPQNRQQRGKLLIVGGQAQGFELPAKAYGFASAAESGEIKVLLPDVLEKLIPRSLMPVVFSASTPTGSFAKVGGQAIQAYMDWADSILLAGDFGRNSQTALFIETILSTDKLITLTKDSFYYFYQQAGLIIDRPQTLLVCSFSQLQKILANYGWSKTISSNMGLVDLVDLLHELSSQKSITVATHWQGSITLAHGGTVTTTKYSDEPTWQLETACWTGVFVMQHPDNPLQAATQAIWQLSKQSSE